MRPRTMLGLGLAKTWGEVARDTVQRNMCFEKRNLGPQLGHRLPFQSVRSPPTQSTFEADLAGFPRRRLVDNELTINLHVSSVQHDWSGLTWGQSPFLQRLADI